METLERIRDICDQYKDCEDGCPFYNKGDCLMYNPLWTWDLDKIEEVLKNDKTS